MLLDSFPHQEVEPVLATLEFGLDLGLALPIERGRSNLLPVLDVGPRGLTHVYFLSWIPANCHEDSPQRASQLDDERHIVRSPQ